MSTRPVPSVKDWLKENAHRFTEREELIEACCEALCVGRRSVVNYVNKVLSELGLTEKDETSRTALKVDFNGRFASVRRERDLWKLRYDDLHKSYELLQTEHDLITSIDIENVAPVMIEPRGKSSVGEACAMAFLTDVHPMERVLKSQVNGLNSYNPAIASQSITTFFEKTVLLTNIHRHATQVKTLVLGMLGDMIGNQLHEDQKETNFGTPQEELIFMLEHLEGGINYLLERGGYEEIIVVGCHGNHDRATKFKQFENQALHSYTWLLYKLLARIFNHEKRVKFAIADGYHLYLPVYGLTWRFHHGDAIKYQGGVGGLTVPAHRIIRQWNSARRADYDVFGHWHTSLTGERFFSVGSVKGYSTYSLEKGLPYEPPQQLFLLLDKKRGVTAEQKIFVR